MWRNKWRNVIEVTIVLIITKNEDRFPPDGGILREDIQDLTQIPRAIPRCARMIGKIFGRNNPRHRGQLPAPNVSTELMKHIALGHAHLALCFAITIGNGGQFTIVWVGFIRRECFSKDTSLAP